MYHIIECHRNIFENFHSYYCKCTSYMHSAHTEGKKWPLGNANGNSVGDQRHSLLMSLKFCKSSRTWNERLNRFSKPLVLPLRAFIEVMCNIKVFNKLLKLMRVQNRDGDAICKTLLYSARKFRCKITVGTFVVKLGHKSHTKGTV